MKLTDLEPEFLRFGRGDDGRQTHGRATTLTEAQGVLFWCPKCGGHAVLVWFRGRGVPDDAAPGPGRWEVSGTGFGDLTLAPSINLDVPGAVGCRWHGWVTAGEIR